MQKHSVIARWPEPVFTTAVTTPPSRSLLGGKPSLWVVFLILLLFAAVMGSRLDLAQAEDRVKSGASGQAGAPSAGNPASLSPSDAVQPESPRDTDDAPAARVLLGETHVFTVLRGYGIVSVNARAQTASQALQRAALKDPSQKVTIQILEEAESAEPSGMVAKISVGTVTVFEIVASDLEPPVNRATVEAHASLLAEKIQAALIGEQERGAIAKRVLAVSSVVFLGLLTLLLLRALRNWSEAAAAFVNDPDREFGALRIAAIELVPAGAVREGLRIAVFCGSWLLRILVVYSWSLFSLSLFDSTRAFAERATGSLLAPVVALLERIASRIPTVFALLLSLILVALLMRFIASYFRAIESGELPSEWVEPSTARVTGGLVLIVIALGALLFIAPLLTGTADGVFTRVGILWLGVLALSTSPILVSCALGVRLAYGHELELGDDLEYGGQRGRVREVGLFDLTLIPSEGGMIKVPHLMSLWHPTKIIARSAEPKARQSKRFKTNPSQRP